MVISACDTQTRTQKRERERERERERDTLPMVCIRVLAISTGIETHVERKPEMSDADEWAMMLS